VITAYAWLAIAATLLVVMIVWDKRVSRAWFVILATAPVAIAYVANPVLRLRSYHSLMHAGIVYQILNGNIPPAAPLVGGYPLKYPWGPHLLVAGMSRVFDVSPLTSFAFLNVAAILLVILLVHRISRLMVNDETANILSVVVAVFGVSLLPYPILSFLQIKVPAAPKGIPVFSKFTNVNALPLGLVFILLSLFSALQLLRRPRARLGVVLMLVSVVGTGFFYFPFLPGLVAGVGAACTVILLLRKTSEVTWEIRPAIVVIATLIVGIVVLVPYLTQIGGGTISEIRLFGPGHAARNLWKALVASGPILFVIILTRRQLAARIPRLDLIFLGSFAAANLASYVFISLPDRAEYKFLVLSTVTMGIVGGVSFGTARGRAGRVALSALLILFIMPSFRSVERKVTPWVAKPPWYFEKGMDIQTSDMMENDLYAWIRENTPPQAIVVDTQLEIPVIAQRQLFVPRRDLLKRRPRRGLASLRDVLLWQCGYDVEMLERRWEITENIYASSAAVTEADLAYLRSLPGPVYVIARSPALTDRISGSFEPVFTAGRGGPSVCALRP
jgi:hypothetical protein